ncbi:MAG: COX aromatic rich motif-containing protein [Candidatus Protochlamydia sp.]|nr:COX aromatic rich motif-containing protein [Candidatus Protochlamydia sp.]
MKKKFLLGMLAIVLAVIAIAIKLSDERTLVFHPKGLIAQQEYALIVTNVLLMLLIIVPTYILLFWVVYKYCIKQDNNDYDPEHTFGVAGEVAMWGFPSIIVAIMSVVTWYATHELDPYKPLESDVKPLTVQVVALDWKWLFIYPEQGIATLNFLHIPEKTPIHFRLTADGAPMNSFWIPQLSGQIYSMAGMSTQLHIMADGPGEYAGRAVEINGEGYSDMTFSARSTSAIDFENWIGQVKKSSDHLTEAVYEDLVKPSINKSTILFSEVEENLYHKIIHKYMNPAKPVL